MRVRKITVSLVPQQLRVLGAAGTLSGIATAKVYAKMGNNQEGGDSLSELATALELPAGSCWVDRALGPLIL